MSIPIYKASDPGAKRLISRTDMLSDSQYTSVVRTIVDGVRTRGDEALFAYTKQFDGIELTPDTVAVTEAEIDAAYKSVPKDLLKSLRRAKDNIVAYQTRLYDIQKSGEGLSVAAHTVVAREAGLMPRRAAFGLQLSGAQCPTGYALRPMDSAGIYVPGGKAAYPSSVLMGVLPAVVAGVPYISVVTPAGKGINPLTLVAARECGANAVFKVGGAQAVAALAYGTASIPGVDMIAGPGNIFVTLAKKEVFGACGIDMLAGPSEIVIVADAAATPAWVAADLLSQAEHDENASAILLTDSEALAKAVVLALDKQLFALPRKEIAAASVTKRSGIILTENLKEAVEIANDIAPEHMELYVGDPDEVLPFVRSAGAVFLGGYSPEPLGDYLAGPDHVLPTMGTARFFSALSVDTFLKKISLIRYTKDMLFGVKDDILTLANTEGLTAHAAAVAIRFPENKGEKP